MRIGLNMNMAAMGLVVVSLVACTGMTTTDATCCAANWEGNCPEGTCRIECTNACNTNNQKNKTMAYSKKSTTADFYKDGKFQHDVAMEAMKEMFAFIADFNGDVPGAAAKDCGNYLDMNLPMAKYAARKYLDEVLYDI